MSTLNVTRIQHTAFRIRSATTSVAIDPALDFFNEMWSKHGVASRALGLLDGLHAVLVTHAHTDHFHPPTLMHLDRSVTIALPREDPSTRHRMADELAELGFVSVMEVGPGDRFQVGDLRVTAVKSPDSIEGIPQLCYLIELGALRVLHTADALEGFGDGADHDLVGVDLALLPLNVSLNADNLRNQMSPATFFQALREMAPKAVVPLGTNEGERRPPSPVAAPWFPFSDPHLSSNAFESLEAAPDLVPLRDGEGIVLDDAPESPPFRVTPRLDLPIRDVEVALGSLRALLYDVHSRSRADFFLDAGTAFDTWRSRWSQTTAAVLQGVADGGALIDVTVADIPIAMSASPVAGVFRASLALAESAHPGTHARALWCLDDGESELGFVQQAYELICGELPDERARWRATLEYVAWLQGRHRRTRPPHPRTWTAHTRAEWWPRQVVADVRAADFVYPIFNPLFGPFCVDGGWSFLVLDHGEGGHSRMLRHRVPAEHTSWVDAIADAQGKRSLAALLAAADGSDSFVEFMLWLVEREPYAVDTHWLPEHRWSWTPRVHEQFTRRDPR